MIWPVRAVAALLLAVLAPVALATAAWADAPLRLQQQVTDRAGVLDDTQVRSALDQLRSDTGAQLFVAYVDSFDGTQYQQWADRTAQLSDLGADDYLLAVAVKDRSYAYVAQGGARVSSNEFAQIARQRVEPRLADGDWTGSAVAAAQGLRAQLTGASIGSDNGSSSSSSSGAGLVLPLLLVAGGVVAAGVVISRRRRARGRPAPDGGAGGPGAAPDVPVEQLQGQADRLLVATDDAVRSSEQEYGFAVAEFGEARTVAFKQALNQARAALQRGFTVRRELADETPEDEPTRRRLLQEVVDLCTRANQALDAEKDRFDELRGVTSSAPQRLEAVLAQADALERDLPAAEAELARLHQRYAPAALTRLDRTAQEARDRLEFARRTAHEGRAALESPDRHGDVATAVMASEEALGQVRQLLDAVSKAGRDLADAVVRLPAALADTRSDLAAARSEGVPEHALAAATSALDRAERSGSDDPLGSLHRVVDADAALDRARSTTRDRAGVVRALDQALLAAGAEVDGVEDYIATRRGAVGSEARTRFAEAVRYLDHARSLRQQDPAEALEAARTADRLAEEAGRLAQQDVDGWYGRGYPGGGRGGVDGSGMLAGILLGEVLGAGRRGGFGGGGFGGGGFGGGGFGGGGFGGGFGGYSGGGSFGGGSSGGYSGGGRF